MGTSKLFGLEAGLDRKALTKLGLGSIETWPNTNWPDWYFILTPKQPRGAKRINLFILPDEGVAQGRLYLGVCPTAGSPRKSRCALPDLAYYLYG